MCVTLFQIGDKNDSLQKLLDAFTGIKTKVCFLDNHTFLHIIDNESFDRPALHFLLLSLLFLGQTDHFLWL